MNSLRLATKARPHVLLRPEPSEIVDRAAYWFGVRLGEMYGLGTAYGLDLLEEKWKPFFDGHDPDAASFARMQANVEPWATTNVVARSVRIEVILREHYTDHRLRMIELTRGWGVPAPALWGAILDLGMPHVEGLLREWRQGYATWVDSGAERSAASGTVQELWAGVIQVDTRRHQGNLESADAAGVGIEPERTSGRGGAQ